MENKYESVVKWRNEINMFSDIKKIIVLNGNIYDTYRHPNMGTVDLLTYLVNMFEEKGYENVYRYDKFHGFYSEFEKEIDKLAKLLDKKYDKADKINGANIYSIKSPFAGNERNASCDVSSILSSLASTVVIMDMASRYLVSPNRLSSEESDSFARIMYNTMHLKEKEDGEKNNVLLIIVEKVNDLPTWFYINNPTLKIINIQTPTNNERKQFIVDELENFFTDNEHYKKVLEDEQLESYQNKFAALTDGFTNIELNEIKELYKNNGFIRAKDFAEVIDIYKFGTKLNPWATLDKKIFKSSDWFEKKVKGQKFAIEQTLDIVRRAMVGMSGIQAPMSKRPRGVLFFAGPTGVGKTELAKTLAQAVFGDENSLIRFDMSEYREATSDQKLLGAPPGYIGYETGGQLTNAVKNNPFSILLFDEIEKADTTIMDKFLQILEDGRITDGQGVTVYLSECIIIFTSNLGIDNYDSAKNMNATEYKEKIKQSIREYFKPEILNRIGENIVVFDYITPDVADEILELQMSNICKSLKNDHGITLIWEKIKNFLSEKIKDNLHNGGRGIGNIVEKCFINPFSMCLYERENNKNCTVEVIGVHKRGVKDGEMDDFYEFDCEIQYGDGE